MQTFFTPHHQPHSRRVAVNQIMGNLAFATLRNAPAFILRDRDVTCHESGLISKGWETKWEWLVQRNYEAPRPGEVKSEVESGIFIGGSQNFGHAIFEDLTKVALADIALEDDTDYPPFIAWRGAKIAAFLDLLGYDHQEALPSVHIKGEAIIPSCPLGRDANKVPYAYNDAIHWARQRLKKFTLTQNRRLYLIRKAAHRIVLNEDEVIQALEPFGFEAIDLSTYSLREQIDIISEAELTVCPVGASSPISLFASGGWIELSPPTIHGFFGSQVFCAATGNPYERINCIPDQNHTDANITVPIERLKTIVKTWEGL